MFRKAFQKHKVNFSFQNKIRLHHPDKLTSRSNLQCHCNNNKSKVHSSLEDFISIYVPGEFPSLSNLGLFYFLCSISWHWPKFSGAEFRVSFFFSFFKKTTTFHFMTSVDIAECGKEQVKTLWSVRWTPVESMLPKASCLLKTADTPPQSLSKHQNNPNNDNKPTTTVTYTQWFIHQQRLPLYFSCSKTKNEK